MSSFERRLGKLEQVLGAPGCTCDGPGLTVIRGSDPAPPGHVCPLHGLQEPLVVRIKSFAEVTQQRAPAVPQFAERLPDGRVAVNFPEPEEQPHGVIC